MSVNARRDSASASDGLPAVPAVAADGRAVRVLPPPSRGRWLLEATVPAASVDGAAIATGYVTQRKWDHIHEDK